MNIQEKLKRIKTEDFIWYIYFFIAIAALYSNDAEKKYYLTNNKNDYRTKKNINILIFTIAFFIYLYFLLITNEDVALLRRQGNTQELVNRYAQLIAALLFLIGGIIYLIIEIRDPVPGEISIL